jgi:hypothetical protein
MPCNWLVSVFSLSYLCLGTALSLPCFCPVSTTSLACDPTLASLHSHPLVSHASLIPGLNSILAYLLLSQPLLYHSCTP